MRAVDQNRGHLAFACCDVAAVQNAKRDQPAAIRLHADRGRSRLQADARAHRWQSRNREERAADEDKDRRFCFHFRTPCASENRWRS
jgi:hypothetical protein